MSSIIAIAGGTSPTLGRSIVTALLHNSKLQPIILARKSVAEEKKSKYGAQIRHVDYDDHASLVAALKDVHTVISVIKIPGPTWIPTQLALLKAAKEAGVKRFAPSEFELGPLSRGKVDIVTAKADLWEACVQSGLECARFSNGMFMNHLSLGVDFGGDATREFTALQGFEDDPVIWDVAAGVAEHPVKDDGTTPRHTSTDIRDIGRFVAAACELPAGQWREDMSMVGETIAVDKVTDLLEEATGKKFERRTIDRKGLQARVDSVEGLGSTREEVVKKLVAQITLAMLDEEVGSTVLEPVVNGLCPQVKPNNVQQYLKQVWKK